MNFRDFVTCVRMLPVDQSVLGQGDHGIGKSQLAYQLAEFFKLNVVERRLSQMTEGDMVGLPVIKDGSTSFMPPDWYLDCCRNARLLFLDELNRATPEVMQAAFEIVLDRRLQGHKLHPQTRVYAMVNNSARYNVNAMDPALRDRFWMVTLEPTIEDWLTWASDRGKIHFAMTDFIKANPKALETPPGKEVDNDKVHPSRRSWEKLDRILAGNNLYEDPGAEVFFQLSVGLVGVEASLEFQNFVKNMDKQISALDILANYPKTKKKISKLGQERLNICIEKLSEFFAKEQMLEEHCANLKAFAMDLPGELRITLWSKLTQGGVGKIGNCKLIHKAIGKDVLGVFGHSKAPDAKAPAAK